LVNHLHEPGHPHPEILKLERPWPPRPPIVGEQKRAMIRQGRGKSIEHVGIEAKVPLGVAIKSVKLTKRWIFPFITPSEAAILKANLMEFT
jgi:hypothetical protein